MEECKLDIITNSPYRVLGVYSTSSQRDIVANQGRMKAFLRVGREVSFPLDLQGILPSISRTEVSVQDAASKLTLPAEQLRYAQFWFSNVTPLDSIACAKLTSGDMSGAVDIWGKRDSASSLQNRTICALICGQYQEAVSCAEKLYSDFSEDFVRMVMGENTSISSANLTHDFLDVLCDNIGPGVILPYVDRSDWKQYLYGKSTQPLIDAISSAIDTAKASRGKGSDERYAAGMKLMNDTKASLRQLQQLLPDSDLQYQMIADKLGLEILQCGIDYFNDSEARDAAHKAMTLQKYAQSVVIGQMARDRCKENVDILEKIIANLPPMEVFDEDKAIKEELRKYCELPDKICHAITLLNNTKPYLQTIKKRLGADNEYYLKISTQVVGNALHNLIEEVNNAQNYLNEIISAAKEAGIDPAIFNDFGDDLSPAKIIDNKLKPALRQAWQATTIMDTFDMEADFKANRYLLQRSSLKGLCNNFGVSTQAKRIASSTPPPKPQPYIPPKPSIWEQIWDWVVTILGVILIGIGFILTYGPIVLLIIGIIVAITD